MSMEKQIEKYGALTPEEVRLRRAAEIVETQLLQMRGQMEGIRARMLRGDLRALKDSAKITSDIRQWLRIAMETEAKLDEFRKKSRGEADGVHAIDFDRARHQIGCRLDRLRRCADAERLPRQPE